MIKAIIFDLDDTLYKYAHLDIEAIDKLCNFVSSKLSLEKEKCHEAFLKARKEVKEKLSKENPSSHNRMLYCQRVLEILGENPFSSALEMYEIYWGYLLNNLQLNKNALELLKKCKEKGIKVGICTNLTVQIQHRKIRKLGIDKYIDAIVTSEEVGVEKPNSKMYEAIVKKIDEKPEDCLFIGDGLKNDVEGPSNYGIPSLWYSDKKNDKFESIDDFFHVINMINQQ